LLETGWAHEFAQPDSGAAPVGGLAGMPVCCGFLALGTAGHGGSEIHSSRDAERLRRFRHFDRIAVPQSIGRWSATHAILSLSETSLNRLCRRLGGSTAFDLIQQRLALEARRRLVYAREFR